MNADRNYDQEMRDTPTHKYAYTFDLDVMHPFMIRSFIPFFTKGNVLELGSFKGAFTKLLSAHFSDITCVEASQTAVAAARDMLGGSVRFVNATFETAELNRTFDNVVLTHVLEHLDDPISLLTRINKDWLSDTGRLFLVCPNGNAASRQIAVRMGIISHNAAVTAAEREHGHRMTYTLDTLEEHARAGGLSVLHRSGIFFKALANFQWDRLLATDIVTPDYLEGCYQLGHVYPDLCASIFLVCEKGDR
jgi:2-polyprenyl-3-methyl-5-hydroxy-6-metoxy-1,4-benzoquinol methylase